MLMYYDNPYVNHLQYQHYPDYSHQQIVNSYNQVIDYNQASNNYIQQTFPELRQDQISMYSQVFDTSQAPKEKIDKDAPTEKFLKDQQTANTITGGVNAVASAIPVYGQIAALANTASGIGRSLLKKDEYGQVKGKFAQGIDAEMTPVHQQVIDDASHGKWGDAALDVVTGGQYKVFKKWFS